MDAAHQRHGGLSVIGILLPIQLRKAKLYGFDIAREIIAVQRQRYHEIAERLTHAGSPRLQFASVIF